MPYGHYGTRMIRTFKDAASKKFALGGASRFSGMNETLARRRVGQLNAAGTLSDLGKLNAVGLHKLKGNLKAFWSIDINGPWRLLFEWRDGDAYEVHFHDPH
jgi:proteic killer suppression protein